MEKHREGRNLLPRTRLRTDRHHIISRLLKQSVSCSTRSASVHVYKKGCVGGVVDTWHVRENHPIPVPDSHTVRAQAGLSMRNSKLTLHYHVRLDGAARGLPSPPGSPFGIWFTSCSCCKHFFVCRSLTKRRREQPQ